MMITLNELKIGHKGTSTLPKISASFPKNGIVLVLGQNGIGKTTLLNTIVGLLKPISGSIDFGGSSSKSQRFASDSIGLAPNQLKLSFDLDVYSLLKMGARGLSYGFTSNSRSQSLDNKTAEHLADFSLLDYQNKNYSELSSGYQKLVNTALCFARDLPVYLLDEPFANVDLKNQIRLMKILRKKSQASLIIMASHCFPEMLMVAEFALLLGENHLFGTTEKVIKSREFGEEMGVGVEIIERSKGPYILFG